MDLDIRLIANLLTPGAKSKTGLLDDLRGAGDASLL